MDCDHDVIVQNYPRINPAVRHLKTPERLTGTGVDANHVPATCAAIKNPATIRKVFKNKWGKRTVFGSDARGGKPDEVARELVKSIESVTGRTVTTPVRSNSMNYN